MTAKSSFKEDFAVLKIGLLILIASCLFINVANANDGKKAYLNGDKVAAFNIWLIQADGGDAEAQFNIAFMYENGEGITLNLVKAIKWYETAARQNYPAAKSMAEKAKTKIREEKAENLRVWLPKAEAGKSSAQHVVAEILAAGEYTYKDNVEAMKWLVLALETEPKGTAHNRMKRFQDSLKATMSSQEIRLSATRVKEWKKLRPEIYNKENE